MSQPQGSENSYFATLAKWLCRAKFPIIDVRRISRLDFARDAIMLDNPEKTARLFAALKAEVPFDVELMPALIKYLQTEDLAAAERTRQTVTDLSYAGDEGGIVCHIVRPEEKAALVVSLTHVHVPRSMPLARAVASYQKHRAKKLRKQSYN